MKKVRFYMAWLAVLMMLCLLLTGGEARAATYSTGTGIQADPYQISVAADWTTLMSTPGDWNKYFLLTSDIDFGGADLTPVGNETTQFTGVFDGHGHVLRNGKISLPGTNYVGLFGFVREAGQIFDLGVENVAVSGGSNLGGLVGYSMGTITSCYTTGPVTGSEVGASSVGGLVGINTMGIIQSCYATGPVTGSDYVGGLVGNVTMGMVSSCSASGAVSGAVMTGGLVGVNSSGTISFCYAAGTVSGTGSVAGGLVATNTGTITSCYARGNVSGYNDVGGLIGQHSSPNGLSSCYSTGLVAGTESLGGLVGPNSTPTAAASYWDRDRSGQSTSGGGEVRTTDEMTYPYATNTYVGWDFALVWATDTVGDINDGYPYLRNCAGPPAETEQGCGCWGTPAKELSLKGLLQRGLGDWLLTGLSLGLLAVYASMRRQP